MSGSVSGPGILHMFIPPLQLHVRTGADIKTQIWIAVSIYVLVAIVKKRLNLNASLYTILQIVSVNLFEKTPLHQLLMNTDNQNDILLNHNQLELFNL